MTGEAQRWSVVREVVARALEAGRHDRPGLLDRECAGDPELRREVESLLSVEWELGSFLEAPAPGPCSTRQEAAHLPAGTSIGAYRVVELLGEGGMGTVYLAERADEAFRKRVAVKVLRDGLAGAEGVRRFRAERQILADLDHPAIARLLDGGSLADGRDYLVMEAVEGEPIDRYCGRAGLPIRQRVALFAKVCRAVHHAHQHLVIHRDLKPSNVLVTAEGEPKLLDFGIAKLLSGDGRPRDGAPTRSPWVPMTPEYASPEQILGQPVGTASDVYALGVILFELLTGERPFHRDGLDLARLAGRVRDGDPPLPSAGAAPALRRELAGDLDSIVVKALAADRRERYESAAALAADLDRYLEGLPVLAAPAGLLDRLHRWTRRHRRLVAALGLAAAVLAAASAWVGLERRRARRTAEVVLALVHEADQMEAIARQAALFPRHDVRADRARIESRLAAIAERLPALSSESRGAARWALGRGEMALRSYARAREHLQQALADGFRRREVTAALGQCESRLYHQALQEAAEAISPALVRTLRENARRRFGVPALAALEAARGDRAEGELFLEALIALQEERFDQARTLAEGAAAQTPLAYEALLLAGEVEIARGLKAAAEVDAEGAARAFDAAGQPFARALEIARSDPAAYVAECDRWLQIVELGRGRAAALPSLLAAAAERCDQALEVDPGHAPALHQTGRLGIFRASEELARGMDPRPTLNAAVDSSRRALKQDPADAVALHNLGSAWSLRADWDVRHGVDPTAALEQAVGALRQATELRPWVPTSHSNLGVTLFCRAHWDTKQSRDPTASFVAATASFERAIALAPDTANAHDGMALARMGLGQVRLERGRLENRAELVQAVEHWRRSLAIDPTRSVAHHNLGAVYRLLAHDEIVTGEDHSASLRLAEESYSRSVAIKPDRAASHLGLGICAVLRASYRLERGEDPSSSLERGRAALAEARRLNPGDAYMHLHRANADLVAARWAIRAGGDPRRSLALAREAISEARRLNPAEPSLFAVSAEVAWREARWRLAAQAPGASPLAEEALGHALRARALRPALVDALAAHGAALLVRAEIGGSALLAAEAASLLERALVRLHYRDPETSQLLAVARRLARSGRGP